METGSFRDMIIQFREVQNVLLFLAAIGALTILFFIVKIIWLICSGGIKLEATLADRRQDKKIKEQEKEIEDLKKRIENLQNYSEEIDGMNSRFTQ